MVIVNIVIEKPSWREFQSSMYVGMNVIMRLGIKNLAAAAATTFQPGRIGMNMLIAPG